MRWFNYEPFKHIDRKQCTVSALREQAQDVDVSLVSHSGGKPPSEFERGYATIGDIVNQMMDALANPKLNS